MVKNNGILTVLAKDIRQGFGSCQPCENQPFRFADCNTAFLLILISHCLKGRENSLMKLNEGEVIESFFLR